MRHLKCRSSGTILESIEFSAPDYKGDEVNWVKYAYREDAVIVVDPGVEITNDSYTKILEDGQVQTIFYSIQRFHQIGSGWYELNYDTVRKEVWDRENER